MWIEENAINDSISKIVSEKNLSFLKKNVLMYTQVQYK